MITFVPQDLISPCRGPTRRTVTVVTADRKRLILLFPLLSPPLLLLLVLAISISDILLNLLIWCCSAMNPSSSVELLVVEVLSLSRVWRAFIIL